MTQPARPRRKAFQRESCPESRLGADGDQKLALRSEDAGDSWHPTGSVNAAPGPTFRLITDIDRLPEWNRAIERVVEAARDLSQGTEWVVKMHPNRGMTWQSRSHVEEIDNDVRRFKYRTWNAAGNPSDADWKWEVVPLGSMAQVSVSWDVISRRWIASGWPAQFDSGSCARK